MPRTTRYLGMELFQPPVIVTAWHNADVPVQASHDPREPPDIAKSKIAEMINNIVCAHYVVPVVEEGGIHLADRVERTRAITNYVGVAEMMIGRKPDLMLSHCWFTRWGVDMPATTYPLPKFSVSRVFAFHSIR